MTANSKNKTPEMGNIFRLFYSYFYLRFGYLQSFCGSVCVSNQARRVCARVVVLKVLCF